MYLHQFWSDDRGAILTAEIVIVTTVLVLAMIVGLTSFQTAVINEVTDLGQAIDSLDQSYTYAGFRSLAPWKIKAWVSGSRFIDGTDMFSNVNLDCSIVTRELAPQQTPAPAPAPVPTPAPQYYVPTPPAPVPCEVPQPVQPCPQYTLPAPSHYDSAPPLLINPGVMQDHCAASSTYPVQPGGLYPSGPQLHPVY